MPTQRITWIDVARGLGIIIVIYSHTLSTDSLRYLFYSFHMPLFFFLSGIIFHHKRHEHFWPMVKKNIRTILLPYFLFAIISYLLWYFTLTSSQPSFSEVINHLKGILYGNNGENILFYNGVLWFLPALFVTKVLFSSFTLLSVRKRFLLLLLFFFSIIGYLFSLFFPQEHLIFGLETALTAVVFFGFGFIWNTQAEKLNKFFKKHAYALFPVFALITLIVSTIHYIMTGYQIDMRLNNLGNYFLFYTASISGILSTVALSKAMWTNKVLEYIGRKSLILFVWHLLVFSYLNAIILPLIPESLLTQLRGTWLNLLMTITTIATILLIDWLYRKGKSKLALAYAKQ